MLELTLVPGGDTQPDRASWRDGPTGASAPTGARYRRGALDDPLGRGGCRRPGGRPGLGPTRMSAALASGKHSATTSVGESGLPVAPAGAQHVVPAAVTRHRRIVPSKSDARSPRAGSRISSRIRPRMASSPSPARLASASREDSQRPTFWCSCHSARSAAATASARDSTSSSSRRRARRRTSSGSSGHSAWPRVQVPIVLAWTLTPDRRRISS